MEAVTLYFLTGALRSLLVGFREQKELSDILFEGLMLQKKLNEQEAKTIHEHGVSIGRILQVVEANNKTSHLVGEAFDLMLKRIADLERRLTTLGA